MFENNCVMIQATTKIRSGIITKITNQW